MGRTLRSAAAAAILTLAALLVSCGDGPDLLRIQTNLPELAALAGMYMADTNGSLVEIEYRQNLSTDASGSRPPDLVLGTGLDTIPHLDNLASLSELFETNPLDADAYYPFTFRQFKDAPRLAVLTWDVPAIASAQAAAPTDFSENVLLPLENLADKAAQHNRVTKSGRTVALGFSPLHDDAFIYLLFQLSGAQISADRRGYPTWDEAGITAAMKRLREWSKNANGGTENERRFLDKYAYAPVFELLKRQTLWYAYSTASDYLALDDTARGKLGVAWLSWQGRIPILDNFVAAGVPQHSPRRAEALRFLRWLLDPANQERIITRSVEDGSRSFGFLGGFSSCRTIAENAIPAAFPPARLRIPPYDLLMFPETQGMLWNTFKNDIFAPWVRTSLEIQNGAPSLTKAVDQWLLQMGLNP